MTNKKQGGKEEKIRKLTIGKKTWHGSIDYMMNKDFQIKLM